MSFKRHAVRLLTWVDGVPMSKLQQPHLMLYHSAGQYLANLTRKLEHFDHHAAHRVHSWDILNTPALRGFVEAIPDRERRTVVEQVIDEFERIQDFQREVPWQVLHADFNNANVVLREREFSKEESTKWEVHGVLDVGDMVYSCRVNDLAIGIAYMLITCMTEPEDNTIHHPYPASSVAPDPLDAAAYFYGGYASQLGLTSKEKEVLHTLVACRLASSYTFGMYSSAQDPHNEYLLLHALPAYDALSLWWYTPVEKVQEMFAAAMVKNAYRSS
eukprot:TRINITY_DN19625_c0_g1_i2.p1 TRINITY_DN19625_c0_g1~~TRINITY_DN19625_c0_g1_i2.p1  ORF type:complete len:273 (+),score=67.64 TRINITY_DN19625_c0_g1_i2:167-985(+)